MQTLCTLHTCYTLCNLQSLPVYRVYKDYTLYLPKYDKTVTTANFSANADQVTKFSYDKHVQDDTQKANEPVSGWEAKPAEKSAGWTPSGFEL